MSIFFVFQSNLRQISLKNNKKFNFFEKMNCNTLS